MPLWKALLLGLYYHASLPSRWWQGRRAAAGHRAALVVLYYHRIADNRATPWTISSRLFDRQIGWLKRHFELISLEETQRRIRTARSDRPAVSITFDDGYGDNCRHAIPVLIREQIPCTYFVSLGHVLDGRPFEHDLAYGRYCPPNSLEQLRAMAAAGIEIGSHTYSHADLGRIADQEQLERRAGRGQDRPGSGSGPPRTLLRVPLRPARQPQPPGVRAGPPGRLRGRLLGLRRL